MEISEVTYLVIFGSITVIMLLVFVIAITFRYYRRNHAYRHQLTVLEYEKNRAILQSQLEIQEQTLQHISNELHDNIAQVASIIKIHLNTLKINDPVNAEQKIEGLKELTKQLISDVKELSVNLSGDRIVRLGLSKALETEIERINKTDLFTATFEQDDSVFSLSDDKTIILYRMAQEVLNNMVKHSNAREIKLKLSENGSEITLQISDDGDGFDVDEKFKNSTGAGLPNLKKRAALIDAELVIKSEPGAGSCFTITVPVAR